MILFRCDAGPQIGFGHLTRCRALAQELRSRGVACLMSGPDELYRTEADLDIFSEWIPIRDWVSAESDAERVVSIFQDSQAQAAVVDDYRAVENHQLVLRAAGIHWLQFEARADQHVWANLVLNASPGAAGADYKVKSSDTDMLLGPKFAVLRPEFAAARKSSDSLAPASNVLITFGAGDDRGATLQVLSEIVPATPDEINFTVVCGENNPNRDQLRRWTSEHGDGRVKLLFNPENMAKVMHSCGLAVMAGGTTTYEAACCGIGMILIAIADNQERHAEAWAETGAAIYLGPLARESTGRLPDMLSSLTQGDGLSKMRQSAAGLVDGLGASRVAEQLVGVMP